MKKFVLFAILCLIFCPTFGQKGKLAHYFDNPIVVDSLSTIIIPTRYNSDFLSSNKIALWGDFYANIVFYNFITDSYKPLFVNDTYIVGFGRSYNTYSYNPYSYNQYSYNQYGNNPSQAKNATSQWIFYRVKNYDRNKNRRIDDKDPAILYVSDLYGNNLKPLTSENENAVSFDIFEQQNFVLIKMQRDHNNNGKFESDDKDFYFIKLDLTTMTFGNKIEINEIRN
ncbi:MAG: hypothetical protein LBN23_06485 [Paludibacter sp.]|jgi:hypothetical protein|nr:hypothetical protein [Paludibacter sp.]